MNFTVTSVGGKQFHFKFNYKVAAIIWNKF